MSQQQQPQLQLLHEYTDASPPPTTGKCVVWFGASWHEACDAGGALDQIITALATEAQKNVTIATTTNSAAVVFGRVIDTDDQPALTKLYSVTAVPTFVCLQNGIVRDRVVGGDQAAAITSAVQRLMTVQQVSNSSKNMNGSNPNPSTADDPSSAATTVTLTERLDNLIRSSEVMVFVKGTPQAPRCGFSRKICELLDQHKIAFATFDILSDEDVRQGLKAHSNWPTYPQVYANGELIGGLDILQEMVDDDQQSLAEQLNVTPTLSLHDRLTQLIHRSPVMLFMKGLPSQPKCGFSRQIVQILTDTANVPFDAFDILTDDEVRQGLKTFSDWPTFPQLYVHGELLGGLDIVQEMVDDGSLRDALVATPAATAAAP